MTGLRKGLQEEMRKPCRKVVSGRACGPRAARLAFATYWASTALPGTTPQQRAAMLENPGGEADQQPSRNLPRRLGFTEIDVSRCAERSAHFGHSPTRQVGPAPANWPNYGPKASVARTHLRTHNDVGDPSCGRRHSCRFIETMIGLADPLEAMMRQIICRADAQARAGVARTIGRRIANADGRRSRPVAVG